MNSNNGLQLVAPQVTPVLGPWFRPAVLANRAFRDQVHATANPVSIRLAFEQSGGKVSHFQTQILPDNHPRAAANFIYLERISKFLLWSRGGCRIHFDGPKEFVARLTAHYRAKRTGRFDSNLVA